MKKKPDVTQPPERSGLRLRIFVAVILFVLGMLGFRLVQMQLLDRAQYSDEALANSVEQKVVQPARGLIYDRNGVLIVDNQPTYTVTLTPRYFERAKLPLLAELLGMPDSLVAAKYREIVAYSPYKTSILFKDVPFAAFARVKEENWQLPGVGFEIEQRRRYHDQVRASHALGYVREITESQLSQMGQQGYRLGDIVGQAGIEREYETVLRGRPGREFVLVNVHGMEVQPYQEGTADIPPQSGFELHLAMDAKVQALAESLFVNKRGGAVAIDVETGGIIAMVSAPDYDPTRFAGRMSQQFVDYIYRNESKPLFNRATQMYQPPGSSWKPFMAAVALAEGMITEDTRLHCGGGYVLGGRLFRCHGGAHGNIGVVDAIRVSCNTFFFRLMNDRINGKRMDLDTFSNWAHRFGFGTLAPLDLPAPNQYRTASGHPGPAYWQQRADYAIDVRLDPATHRVTGSETITYTNNSPQALDFLWLHLEQNLFAPGSRGGAITPAGSRWRGSFPGGGFTLDRVEIVHGGKTYAPEHFVDIPIPRCAHDIGLELASRIQRQMRRAQRRECQSTVVHPMADYHVFVEPIEREARLARIDQQRCIFGPTLVVKPEIRPLERTHLDRMVEGDGVHDFMGKECIVAPLLRRIPPKVDGARAGHKRGLVPEIPVQPYNNRRVEPKVGWRDGRYGAVISFPLLEQRLHFRFRACVRVRQEVKVLARRLDRVSE